MPLKLNQNMLSAIRRIEALTTTVLFKFQDGDSCYRVHRMAMFTDVYLDLVRKARREFSEPIHISAKIRSL